jgi:hypothetical protein
MSSDKNELAQVHRTYAALSGLFLAILALFSLLGRRKEKEVKPLDIALLGLSSFRMGRLVAYDLVMEPYRQPFTETVPDPTGAGDTVRPKGSGWRRAVGTLIACPICAGTWIAAGLAYGLQVAPGPTRLLMTIMGSIGLGEVLNALTEMLSWGGQAAREQAGTAAMAKARSQQGSTNPKG